MAEKECFKCLQTKPLSEFYRHSQMADGHLNKCKECAKKDVSTNYRGNIAYYKAYEATRNQKHERKLRSTANCKQYRKKYPEKYQANSLLNSAVNCGRINRPDICSLCGRKDYIHGHHEDYRKPLDVAWVCPSCHSELHKFKATVPF